MRLVLVRHGEAEPLFHADHERALTTRGQHQAAETAGWLHDVLTGTFVLACSPYRRARETAAFIQQMSPQATLKVVGSITPENDVRSALVALGAVADAGAGLVVVSHMPLVAGLASWIDAGVLSGGQPFGLAEARVYDLDVLAAAQGTLIKRFNPAS